MINRVNDHVKVDPVKFIDALKKRQLNCSIISIAYGKNYTYANQRLHRYNNTLPNSFVCFMEKTYGIKPKEYIVESVENVRMSDTQDKPSKGSVISVDGEKIKAITAKANMSLYRASLNMGHGGAYLSSCICKGSMSSAGAKRFIDLFKCDVLDIIRDGSTPPPNCATKKMLCRITQIP